MSDSDHPQLSPQNSSKQLNYIEGSSNQVLGFLNANSRRYVVKDEDGQPSGTEWEWWSRENRKGRHILLLNRKQAPSRTERTTRLFRTLARMLTVVAWWDISWWTGVLFTFGSLCSITAGVIQWLPIAYPSAQFGVDPTIISGIIALVRGMVFLLGSMLMVVEAVNANQSDCFGWALEEAMSSSSEDAELASVNQGKTAESISGFRPDRMNCSHLQNRDRIKHRIMHTNTFQIEALPTPEPHQEWKWWPTWDDFWRYYRREIGFDANLILFVGALVYLVTNVLTLPGIYKMLPQGVLYGLYYLSFLLGALCFLISSILNTLEVQHDWWKPSPKMVGWWIGMTNMVGSIGWLWSASLGYCSSSWCEYQSALALVWAPGVYLIGSVLLIYEALEKWPIHVVE